MHANISSIWIAGDSTKVYGNSVGLLYERKGRTLDSNARTAGRTFSIFGSPTGRIGSRHSRCGGIGRRRTSTSRSARQQAAQCTSAPMIVRKFDVHIARSCVMCESWRLWHPDTESPFPPFSEVHQLPCHNTKVTWTRG